MTLTGVKDRQLDLERAYVYRVHGIDNAFHVTWRSTGCIIENDHNVAMVHDFAWQKSRIEIEKKIKLTLMGEL